MKNFIVILIVFAFVGTKAKAQTLPDLTPVHIGYCHSVGQIPHPQGRDEIPCMLLTSNTDEEHFWVMVMDDQSFPVAIYEVDYRSGVKKVIWTKPTI